VFFQTNYDEMELQNISYDVISEPSLLLRLTQKILQEFERRTFYGG